MHFVWSLAYHVRMDGLRERSPAPAAPILDGRTPADVWRAWLADETRSRLDEYALKPGRLASDFYADRSHARDQHGRELLELLQNADDEADDPEKSRAVIFIDDHGICVGNTGHTFTSEGVDSLMLPNNSPKRRNRARYIGNKGLGFRSVLSWTTSPIISSGNLALTFDSDHCARKLEELAARSPRIAEILERERAAGLPIGIPVLALPIFLDDATAEPRGEPFHKTLLHARQLVAERLTTVVALPFDVAGAAADVREQLASIRREVLLFTKNLRTLEIRAGEKPVVWTIDRSGDEVRISSSEEKGEQVWKIVEDRGPIPFEHLPEGTEKQPDYEVKVAIQVDGAAKTHPYLVSYFPTQARFPFPLVAHATVELTNNRQNLIQSKANAFVLGRLADLMARAAEETAPLMSDPWRPLSLVTKTGALDPEIEKQGFLAVLIAAASSRRLVAVRAGDRRAATAAKQLARPAPDWLPTVRFEDVVKHTENTDLRAMLDTMQVGKLQAADLRTRLDGIASLLEAPALAALVAGLIDTHMLPTFPSPPLLRDASGRLLSPDADVFLAPEGAALDLPAWVALDFLEPALAAELQARFKITTRDELVSRLFLHYKLKAYRFGAVVDALVAATETEIARRPADALAIRREVIGVLFRLYRGGSSLEDRARKIELPTCGATTAPATSLYLSNAYPGGVLADALYRGGEAGKLVAAPPELGLEGVDVEEIERFLRWMSVAELPRRQRVHPLKQLREQMISEVPKGVAFGDYTLKNVNELRLDATLSCDYLDGFAKILATADPHAIITWLHIDPSFESWRTRGDTSVELSFKPKGKQKERTAFVPLKTAAPMHELARTPWLPTDRGKQPPRDCVRTQSKRMAGLLPSPAVDLEHPLFKTFALDRQSVNAALARAGVKSAIDQIPWDEIYRLLLELSDGSRPHDVVRAFYRAIASRTADDAPDPDSLSRRTFLANGKLLAKRRDGYEYLPVGDVRYDHNGALPAAVARELALIDIEARQGPDKIKKQFGVERVDARAVKTTVREAVRVGLSDGVAAAVEELKRFVIVLQELGEAQVARLRDLEVIVCERISGTAHVDGRGVEIHVSSNGELVLDGSKVYVIAQVTHSLLEGDVLLADAVTDAIATALDLDALPEVARVGPCNESVRLNLLARILRTNVDGVWEKLDDADRRLWGAEAPLSIRTVHSPEPPPAPPPAPAPEKKDEPPAPAPTKPADANNAAVKVSPRPHEPTSPREIPFRVRRNPSGPAAVGSKSRLILDPRRAETIAERFEKEEKRFPHYVGHAQGRLAYGCDILSFDTDAKRQEFLKTDDRSLVDRWIEVKGRVRDTACVLLGGNELRTAEARAAKSFLYRVYEAAPNRFQVLVLANPANRATGRILEVDLKQSAETEAFDVDLVESG